MNARVVNNILLIGLLIFILAGCFGCAETQGQPQASDPEAIVKLDADYYIDYENGTIPISNLPIGARVVDPSWEPRGKQAVVWLIVAKNHYEELEPHVTLLAEEVIYKDTFDNSSNRDSEWGSNHWGDSGTPNATRGMRPLLNSTGIHAGEGFYQNFSENFKEAVLATIVPNREWEKGTDYDTQDYVFIPSITELGDSKHEGTYVIGTAYPYFQESGDIKRAARDGGTDGGTWWYWSRSPVSGVGYSVCGVTNTGEFTYSDSTHGKGGVRPVLNLKSNTMVTEVK